MIFIPCHTFLCYTLGKSQRYHRDSALLTLNQKTQLFSAESWTDALTDTPISLQMLFSSSFFLFISFSFLLVLFFSISVKTLSLLCLFDNVTAPWACLFFSTWILSALQVYSHDSVPCLFSFHSFDYWLPIFFFLKHKATHSFSAMSIQVDGTMCYRNGHHHYQQHQRPFKRFFIQIILFVYIFETCLHTVLTSCLSAVCMSRNNTLQLWLRVNNKGLTSVARAACPSRAAASGAQAVLLLAR